MGIRGTALGVKQLFAARCSTSTWAQIGPKCRIRCNPKAAFQIVDSSHVLGKFDTKIEAFRSVHAMRARVWLQCVKPGLIGRVKHLRGDPDHQQAWQPWGLSRQCGGYVGRRTMIYRINWGLVAMLLAGAFILALCLRR
ncbi:hypothetical protein [Mesorhizobium sp.]|uniref:hypothetical protein n=1 Tax=Mesorhizobium sp. TaxID=1871066 RepID=UPI000FE8D24A|nr:hypothetical protein [Mesorhizobium sp.]RWC38927.1 MAG: hypothetical protein EOS28_28585 [Mesorhizobium sp.]RWE84472.1 MAG: hypothetical protein EOS49_21020 [Mesorhizobium sp.]RWE90863.1 MAG: hypothetical protein EOS68_29765 [Mesorhizobium sp.]TIS66080.1 MAG: hypothetical protein E5W92_15985 [Mesorhizobium sp.]